MSFEIPEGLGDMLRDFTVAVLRERPADIYDFAIDYFTRVRENRKPKTVPMYIMVDEGEAGEPEPSSMKPKTNFSNRAARRQPVSAGKYDPEADNDDEKVVHPKTDEQRRRLTEAVCGILIFRSLDSDQMQDVLDAMIEKKVNHGEEVITQGDDGDNFYVIDTGTYDVFVETHGTTRKIHQFVDTGSFGELALLHNMPRSATVTAVSEGGKLWAMDRNSFRRIVLKRAFNKRKMYEDFLENVPILKSLDQYERMSLADALVSQNYTDKTQIIKQGDGADGMYFVERGQIRVTIEHKSEDPEAEVEEVGRLSKGSYFGELALIENKPRSANVYAAGDIQVAFLQRDSFERLLGPCLDIMKRNSELYKQYTEQTM